jgi:hypothetical protein
MPPKRKLQSAKQPVSRKGHAAKKTRKEVEEVVEKEGAALEVEVAVAKAAMLEVAVAEEVSEEVSEEVAAVFTEQTELAEVAPGPVSEILMDQMELPARAASKAAEEVTVAPALVAVMVHPAPEVLAVEAVAAVVTQETELMEVAATDEGLTQDEIL